VSYLFTYYPTGTRVPDKLPGGLALGYYGVEARPPGWRMEEALREVTLKGCAE